MKPILLKCRDRAAFAFREHELLTQKTSIARFMDEADAGQLVTPLQIAQKKAGFRRPFS